jgi:hypothetical protein
MQTTEPVLLQTLTIIENSGFPLSIGHFDAFCFYYVKTRSFDKWRSIILEHPKLEIFAPEGTNLVKIQRISEKIAQQMYAKSIKYLLSRLISQTLTFTAHPGDQVKVGLQRQPRPLVFYSIDFRNIFVCSCPP